MRTQGVCSNALLEMTDESDDQTNRAFVILVRVLRA
ncbi:unnamed protein product [Ceutorhynchus assimilis]|uniref:Uncharacterized protein n=1 Tax=Ceutorhynchus assimilis TaxID=467358 RepID=A0A9N9MFT1_9CUCU|nr:unnamed protein product [Ceutorhynchus assimilis]